MKMMKAIAFLGGVVLMSAAARGADVKLKVGDAAPDFKLKGSDGMEYTVSQFKGKSAVVLNFFPKAFTGG